MLRRRFVSVDVPLAGVLVVAVWLTLAVVLAMLVLAVVQSTAATPELGPIRWALPRG